MRQIKILIGTIISATVLTSCNDNGENPPVPDTKGNLEMSFNFLHPAQTRATDTAFETGDDVGLYVGDASLPLEIGGNTVNNERLIFSGSGWTSYRKLYWDKSTYNVYAYHPHIDNVTSITDLPVEVAADQTAEGYGDSDFLHASALNVDASENPVNLQFRHLMSKLTVRLIKGEDYEGEIPANAIVYIHNTVTDATVDLLAGVATRDPKGSKRTIRARRNGLANYSAIIVPQRLDNRMPLIEVVANGVSFLYESRFQFKPGMHHIINLVIDRNPEQDKIEIIGNLSTWN